MESGLEELSDIFIADIDEGETNADMDRGDVGFDRIPTSVFFFVSYT